jgi:RHS repeat-associated protein
MLASPIAYFLGDALGSVRQLTNSAGEVTFAKSYDPYGVVTQSSGEARQGSAYGYTGEQQSNDRVYLRARYYSPLSGRLVRENTKEIRGKMISEFGYGWEEIHRSAMQ